MRSGVWGDRRFALLWGLLLAALVLVGCDGSNGTDGQDGTPGESTATLSGKVTNALTGGAVPGAIVETDPAIPGVNIVADGAGNYSVTLPIGKYDLTCMDAGFDPGAGDVSIVSGQPANVDFGLMPTKAVVVTVAGLPPTVKPGDTFNLTVTTTPMDGSTVQSFLWTQTNSVDAGLDNATTQTVTVSLPNEQAYRDELFTHIEDIEGRWQVQGVVPLTIEEAGHVGVQIAVTTTSGVHTAMVDIHADLDFVAINPGLRNVPRGLPVLMSGPEQASYNWMLTSRPAGSAAAFNNGALRRPTFTPDVAGIYTVEVFDIEEDEDVTFEIFAGTWVGAITGMDINGRPDSDCTLCHNAGGTGPEPAADVFTKWKETGHAEIFTNNLNSSAYWGTQCFACHTVGYDPAVNNGGIEEAGDYAGFLTLLGNPQSSNWATTLSTYPETARLANIQCENCHGPNTGPSGEEAHKRQDGSRVSLSSDVCGTCHGEPLRHARFQQWELSGHNNYELALSRGVSGSCGRCHSANGFIKWVPNLLDDDETNDASSVVMDWDAQTVHPQTCAACHDPHDIGTRSGSDPLAKVRIEGDTANMESGFKATGVGMGALCMTCHNGRRGLRNDNQEWPPASNDPGRAPHGRPNSGIIMGQNAYFMPIGTRAAHSLIDDTCVTCHMELTDPPADLSYNLGGTNHTFEASDEICGNCHGDFTAGTLKNVVDTAMHDLELALIAAIKAEIEYQIDLGGDVEISGATEDEETDLEATITDIDQVGDIHLETSHGRQAMTIVVDGVEIHHVQVNRGTNIDGGPNDGESLIDVPNGEYIAKAGWNYWTVDHDGSHGIHNPTFVINMLNFARQALETELTYPEPE